MIQEAKNQNLNFAKKFLKKLFLPKLKIEVELFAKLETNEENSLILSLSLTYKNEMLKEELDEDQLIFIIPKLNISSLDTL